MIDVYLSETRDTAAATAFFAQTIVRTDVWSRLVTTDKAPTHPPAARAVVPEAEHITGKTEQQGIKRDHQRLNMADAEYVEFPTLSGVRRSWL